MTEPTTVNTGLIVGNTGDLPGAWASAALNPDFVAIDGYLAGVQAISASNVPITLTAPAAFVPTPGGGPTQAQNRVLRFTGVLTGDVRVTLPLPGAYIIENLTTGNFVLSFQGVAATEVIGTPQGERINIYNDGANVRFVGLARMGAIEHWAGLTAMPSWVSQCTVAPYLLCDSAVHNYSDFPFLGPRLAGNFGGNGITTFATPDLRGRVPLAYDGTGTRITVAGCGINGQTIGASRDQQTITLAANQIPTITATNATQSITVAPVGRTNVAGTNGPISSQPSPSTGGNFVPWSGAGAGDWTNVSSMNGNNNISATYTNNAQVAVNNVQPSQVVGIWVIKS